jgi:hypothetical protein
MQLKPKQPAWFVLDDAMKVEITNSLQARRADASNGSRKRRKSGGKRSNPLGDQGDHMDVPNETEETETVLQFRGRLREFRMLAFNNPAVLLLEKFINDKMPRGPDEQEIKSVKISVGKLQVAIVVMRGKFCANVKREHGSADVWCLVDRRKCTITQRCWSRKYGCSEYISPEYKLPEALVKRLFAKYTVVKREIRRDPHLYVTATHSQASKLEATAKVLIDLTQRAPMIQDSGYKSLKTVQEQMDFVQQRTGQSNVIRPMLSQSLRDSTSK